MDETNQPPAADSEPVLPVTPGTNPSPRQLRARRLIQKRSELKASFRFNWLVLPLVFLMGLGSGWLVWGRSAVNPTSPQVTVDQNVKRYNVSVDNNPSLGPQDAPITIIEFSDYQCPYCVRWYQDVYQRLMETYKGKIRFVYRDFPLDSIHPEAEPAAEAANCAGEQNAYWQYHDALFGRKNGLGAGAYLQYAGELGLNTDQFSKCLNEHRYAEEIAADVKYAYSVNVSSTPTFFVNGLAVVGAQPFEVFQQLIDMELAGKLPK